ncbi:hypothetical protein IWQ48_003822 [Labrenzia sp. EL_13]|nr:hypothetical protein [Labrenzia sp. EL_13]
MRAPRLSIIPARAATDPELKPRDLQVLCVLGRHTDELGWCRRSQVKMAREMDCARSTVQAAIGRLTRQGYLEQFHQETESGRDSSHIYRVILDPVHEDVSTIRLLETDRDAGSDACETLSILPCRSVGTPADIPAPPAGAESAPPADPESAPMLTTPLNDPLLTERESAREVAARDGLNVSKDAWKRRFRKTHAEWPTYASDSATTAEVEWFNLSEPDREAAADRLGAYVLHVRQQLGRSKFCAFAVYLRDKLWERVPENAAGGRSAQPLEAKPFGKAWGAARFACLMLEPTGAPPKLTTAQEQMIDQGLYSRDDLLREKRAMNGWPRVNTMHERAVRRRLGVACDPALAGLADLFGKVHRDSPAWIAWRDLHAKKGWPWFGPDRDCPEWVWMPAPPDAPETYANPFAEVRAALARFEAEHANLTQRQAAE